ncbi:MAG: GspH/FimT family pseudopilin [Pseudomonadota bacterium]
MTPCDAGKAGRPLFLHFRRDPARRKKLQTKKGFTLVEILIVVLVMGIVTMMCLPLLQAALRDSRISGAASEIVTALQFAQATAMSAGGLMRITVNAVNDTILVEKFKPGVNLLGTETTLNAGDVEGGSYAAVGHPYSKGADYLITFSAEDRFQGVDISSSLFGANDFVIFDALGAPSAGGTVTLSAGSRTLTISVNALNGKVLTSG